METANVAIEFAYPKNAVESAALMPAFDDTVLKYNGKMAVVIIKE